MKIALVTMNVKAGRCEENVAYMKEKIHEARCEQVDLIIFPQNAISGYLLSDQWLDAAWCQYVDHFNDVMIQESHDIAIVWGNIRYRNHRRFNAAFFAYEGKTHMRVKKNEKLAYVDDQRYFENNAINSAIEYKNLLFALNFGNEIQLADMNINIDARAYDMDETMNIHGNVIYVNACGMQNSGSNVMIMPGGSFVMNQQKLYYHAPYFTEEMHIMDLNTAKQEVDKPQASLLDACVMGIQNFDQQVFGGKQPWIVGLSGGLDSSVTAALLAYALGSKRVYGYNLATRYNREVTISNAQKEAEALGIQYTNAVIESFVEASKAMFVEQFQIDVDQKPTLVLENLQARSRGFMLSGIAAALGGVVVNNANKVEAALGYCTLYGDSIGAISLIGDLTKVQLFALSHEINMRMGKEVIPASLLPEMQGDNIKWEMPPSAELRDDQFDPMKWFYHDYLVEHLGRDLSIPTFMQQYLDQTLDKNLVKWIHYYGLDQPQQFIDDLEWFISTMHRNAFKRLQMPPLLSLHHATLANRIETQMRFDNTLYDTLKRKILDGNSYKKL